MSWTQADIDSLRRDIAAAGATGTVRFADGTEVRYLTPREAGDKLAMMEAHVRVAAAGRLVRGFRVAIGGGGY